VLLHSQELWPLLPAGKYLLRNFAESIRQFRFNVLGLKSKQLSLFKKCKTPHELSLLKQCKTSLINKLVLDSAVQKITTTNHSCESQLVTSTRCCDNTEDVRCEITGTPRFDFWMGSTSDSQAPGFLHLLVRHLFGNRRQRPPQSAGMHPWER